MSQSYFIQQATTEAKKLYSQLSKKYIKTPVYDPINLSQPENLITIATNIIQKPIYIKCPDIGDTYVDAYILHHSDKAEILISSNANYCHARYLVCKELMHLFLYNPTKGRYYNATATIANIKKLLSDVLNHSQQEEHNPQLFTDDAAYFGAIELLIPSHQIDKIRLLKQQFIEQKLFPNQENLELAKLLGVPEFILEFRLNVVNDKLFNLP